MKKYHQLIFYYMKKQFKHTISVMLAIIIASALMICMLTLNKSRIKNQIDMDMYEMGKFHSIFYNLTQEELAKLKQNNRVKELAVRTYLGFGRLKNTHGIEIEGFDKKSIKMFDYSLAAGHFPQHNDEIVVEKWMLDNLRLKHVLGQRIEFNYINQYKDAKFKLHTFRGKAQFKLVGILNDNHYSKSSDNCAITTLEIPKKLLPQEFFNYEGFAVLKNYKQIKKQTSDIKKNIRDKLVKSKINEALADDYDSYNDNGSDLRNLSAVKDFLYNNLPIIIAVFMIIFNIFNMSVMKRFKDYGVLRAIGAKPHQIRVLIFGEAFYLTLFSIPIGVICGAVAAKIFVLSTNRVIDKGVDAGRKIFVPVNGCIIAILTICIAIIFSVVLPAIRAGKVSALHAMSDDAGSIKQKRLKISKIYRFFIKHFGINTTMAFQNIWRNKRRFFITVLCMCISGSLFLDKTNRNAIFEYMDRFYCMQQPFVAKKAQYRIITSAENHNGIKTGYSYRDYSSLKKEEGVTDIEATRIDWSAQLAAGKNIFTKQYKNYMKRLEWEITTFCPIVGHDTRDINYYKRFLLGGKVNLTALKNKNVVLLENEILDEHTFNKVPITKYKAGDTIKVRMGYKTSGGEIKSKIQKLTIGGIINRNGFMADVKGQYGLNIIMHENLFKRLTNCNTYQEFDIYAKDISKNKRLGYELKNMAMRINDGEFLDESKEMERTQNSQKQNDVIDGGILLSLVIISILNIFNTMSTNILQRTKELGLLRIVGDTRRQLTNMIVTEALVYGFVSMIVSFIAGNIITYSYYTKIHKSLGGLKFIISWQGTLILFCVSIIVCIIASLIPLRRIKKTDAIESIRMVE